MTGVAPARLGAVSSAKPALRVLVALLGGYGFARGFVALATATLAVDGLSYDDAWLLAAMLAFPLLLTAVIWTFGSRHLLRVALVLGGGTAMMSVAAHVLARLGSGSI